MSGELKKKIVAWIVIFVFVFTATFTVNTKNVAAGDGEGPYGWTVKYQNPSDETELVSIDVEFDESNCIVLYLPCEVYDADIWSSLIVSGCDYNGSFVTVDTTVNEDGCGVSGEVYMMDNYGSDICYSVYINKTQHMYDTVIEAKEATCQEYGYTVHKCGVCGKTSKDVDETYLGEHVWKSSYTIDKKATYFAAGQKSKYCSVCKVQDPDSVVIIPKKTLAKPFVFGASITPDLSKSGGYDDLRVSWEKVTGATGYQVQYRVKGTTAWKKYNDGKLTSKRKVYLKNMKDGTRYQVRVRACVKAGDNVAYSGWVRVLSTMTLAKVNITSIKNNSGNYVTIKWKGIPTAGEDGYEVYRATSKNGTYKKVAEVCQKSKEYPSVKVYHKKGKTYYYKVKAFSRWDGNHKLYGPWSTKIKKKR